MTVGDLPEEERPGETGERPPAWPDEDLARSLRRALAAGVGLREISNTAAGLAVELAIRDTGGNLQRAAERLAVTDRALQMRRKRKGEGGDRS
jgi:DNA-binding NtrC family response regulator